MKKIMLALVGLLVASSMNTVFAKSKPTSCTSDGNCSSGQVCSGETGKMTCQTQTS